MKIKTFNKKIKKVNRNIVQKANKKHSIPVNFFKGNNILTFENVLNQLPDPIKMILKLEVPTRIKAGGGMIRITTISKLDIFIKEFTLNNIVPECRIFDKPNKTYLLNTFKA